MTINAPSLENVLMRADDPFWKEFVSKPALKYILRALTGLSTKHSPTQMALAKGCIPILHQMEQVSTDEHVGSLGMVSNKISMILIFGRKHFKQKFHSRKNQQPSILIHIWGKFYFY